LALWFMRGPIMDWIEKYTVRGQEPEGSGDGDDPDSGINPPSES